MPITQSAKKAVKVSARKKVFNDRRRRVMREETKVVKSIVAGKVEGDAAKELSKAYKAIDKAAKRGVIKKNTAARKKSRLATAVAKAVK
ncbi:MAG: 30S ribosomal protein S20 [Candidatus Yonathbacteria bacterium]|nr:30S ribosomal protein S20 [Candidatus Yonathbacteria bacterium]NTW47668.1 30S ribosomal protein S20 [Candidatus Yonathbacteria bacterium]